MADEYPQWLTFPKNLMSGIDTYTQIEANVNPPTGKVLEIIRTEVQWPEIDVAETATGAKSQNAQITTQSKSTAIDLDASGVIWANTRRNKTVYAEPTETGGGPTNLDPAVEGVDYATVGKGPLFSAAKLYFGVDTVSHGSAQTFRARVLYRFIKVSSEELIALQQSSN